MEKNEKPGGGGRRQLYIPKGHGAKSGQYCRMTEGDYVTSERCTKEELRARLTEWELFYVRRYSDFTFGRALNKAIREKRMSLADKVFKSNLVSAIGKHKLLAPITVYRGIMVSLEVYRDNFYRKYIHGESIVGSVICSTSRKLERATSVTDGIGPDFIGIVFEIDLPKGYSALPIESIAMDPDEQEILLSSPRYVIDNIRDCESERGRYKLVKARILGGNDNEN